MQLTSTPRGSPQYSSEAVCGAISLSGRCSEKNIGPWEESASLVTTLTELHRISSTPAVLCIFLVLKSCLMAEKCSLIRSRHNAEGAIRQACLPPGQPLICTTPSCAGQHCCIPLLLCFAHHLHVSSILPSVLLPISTHHSTKAKLCQLIYGLFNPLEDQNKP